MGVPRPKMLERVEATAVRVAHFGPAFVPKAGGICHLGGQPVSVTRSIRAPTERSFSSIRS
jgi:hypothetical protein